MPAIAAGQITAFYLFDVADSFDLTTLPALIAGPASPARLAAKPALPSYVQYAQPPLSFDGEAVGMPEIGGLRARVRVYDYGVVSFALTRRFAGEWTELAALGQELIENETIELAAEQACRALCTRLAPAVAAPRPRHLSEDYLVFSVYALEPPASIDDMLRAHGDDIARMLRGEREPLAPQERDEVLRHRISYLATDLVVPAWNSALVVDSEAGAQGTLEILEFANSQLLEFRYYDDLLDAQLGEIYAELQHRRRYGVFTGRRYIRAADRVHTLFIDVNELTDKAENALKIVGDVYAARLFALTGARLALDAWKASVREKLETLDDIYRFAVEQAGIARGNLLELTIVLILIFELVLFFLGMMR